MNIRSLTAFRPVAMKSYQHTARGPNRHKWAQVSHQAFPQSPMMPMVLPTLKIWASSLNQEQTNSLSTIRKMGLEAQWLSRAAAEFIIGVLYKATCSTGWINKLLLSMMSKSWEFTLSKRWSKRLPLKAVLYTLLSSKRCTRRTRR